MKIAQVVCIYPPARGGIGTVAHDYTEALLAAGHEVSVFSPAHNKPVLKWGNGAFFPQFVWQLKSADIIHLHYPFFGGAIAAALASFVWRKPLIVSYHMIVRHSGLLGYSIELYKRIIEPLILRRASQIWVSTFDYAESIGLKSTKLVEKPFMVDVDHFSNAKDMRSELRIKPTDTVFISVNSMKKTHYFKGVDVLLQAFARLSGDAKLILIGDGELQPGYKKLAKRLGLDKKVIFAGNVDDTAPYFKSSDCHVLPSINQNEAFGIVTLEAMAAGIPSIVSDLPGVRVVPVEDETGWVVEPGNIEAWRETMQSVVNDKEEAERRGKLAHIRVRTYFDEKNLAQTLQESYDMLK